MEGLMLVRPIRVPKEQIVDYREEFLSRGEARINGSCGLHHYEENELDQWLRLVTSIEADALSEDGIHASTFFSVRESDGMIIGTIQLRHTLTPELSMHAGHIGYGVRPSQRRKGYGARQLALALEVARQLNLPRVMISCEASNEASRRTILHCGGTLAEENEYRGVAQQIYWIELT